LLLLEEVARRLKLDEGICRLEAELQDGRVLYVWRHCKLGAQTLMRRYPVGERGDVTGGVTAIGRE
jgi:hypothetical protein